jgi:hypothetical protein
MRNLMIFKTIMIRVKGNPISERYANYCAKSWEGFNLRMYDAITPDTLADQSGLNFGTRGNGRELTATEKACFYSQYNLWKKCAIENVPILILEHDAWLENPSAITFNPHLELQFFGQHAMEAVMFHPRFAKRLMNRTANSKVSGPMQLVDELTGYFNKGKQSRFALPHARYMGPQAPVKSVIDPKVGTTVGHDGTTADRLKDDADLFKIIDLANGNIR